MSSLSNTPCNNWLDEVVAAVSVAPYYRDDAVVIFNADCREIVPHIPKPCLLLTDPPYGIERFRKGFGTTRFRGLGCETKGIEWDVAPDAEWLAALLAVAPLAVVWGMNNLPLPTTEHFLVWDKENGDNDFADGEMAWNNLGCALRIKRHLWAGMLRKGGEERHHPTQKPLEVIQWAMNLAGNVQTILDPWAGSGTTGHAAKNLGKRAVLIEREERYCEIAARRLAQDVLPLDCPNKD